VPRIKASEAEFLHPMKICCRTRDCAVHLICALYYAALRAHEMEFVESSKNAILCSNRSVSGLDGSI